MKRLSGVLLALPRRFYCGGCCRLTAAESRDGKRLLFRREELDAYVEGVG